MKIFTWKRTAVLAPVAAALALAPLAAAADQPQQATVPISFSLTDYSLCGFAIAESATGEIDKTIFPDGSQIWHIHRYSTFSANGKTLTSDANFTRFLDPTQPNLINDAAPSSASRSRARAPSSCRPESSSSTTQPARSTSTPAPPNSSTTTPPPSAPTSATDARKEESECAHED